LESTVAAVTRLACSEPNVFVHQQFVLNVECSKYGRVEPASSATSPFMGGLGFLDRTTLNRFDAVMH
jgi:hypothetical protein